VLGSNSRVRDEIRLSLKRRKMKQNIRLQLPIAKMHRFEIFFSQKYVCPGKDSRLIDFHSSPVRLEIIFFLRLV
jgi:hypothetical protein